MKKLLVIAALIGVAASGPVRTPRDVATSGTNAPMAVKVQSPKSKVQGPVTVSAALMPQFVVVTNTNRPPYTNVPQLDHAWWGFVWQATNGPGFTTYLVMTATNVNGPWTNVVEQVTPNGLPHTNWIHFDRTQRQVYFRLFRF